MSTLARTRSLLGHALVSALILMAGLVVAGDGPSAALEEVTATVDDDAPGMIHVAWPVEESHNGHRITWWTGTDTEQSPTGSAIRTADWPRTTESAITLTGLATGAYTVRVDATQDRSATPRWTEVGRDTATIAVGPLAPSTPCPASPTFNSVTIDVIFCVDITNPSAFGTLDLSLEWISGGTGGTMYKSGDRLYGVADPAYARPRTDSRLDPQNAYGDEDWYRVRIQIKEYTGRATSRWWTQPGLPDDGTTFMTATDFLVSAEDDASRTPPTFEITLDDAGALLSGTITKDVDGVATALDRRSFFSGGDIASPCIAVFAEVNGEWPWVQDICAWGGTPDSPQDGGFENWGARTGPGDWSIRLPEGDYKIRFIDRTSFDIGTSVLEMEVRFVNQWYSDDGTTAENVDQATAIEVVNGSPRAGLDVTLRDARQLSVVVTDVPEGFRDSANVVVTDEFGNWFQGAAELDAEDGTWTTAFTGLVEGRRYKVFLYFSGDEGYRWWLVGGGTIESADGVIPSGDRLVEPWQPMAYAVAVVDQYGTPWGPGEACFSLLVAGEDDEEIAASSCTDTVDGTDGVVVLQRVLSGTYRVAGWVQDPATGDVIGTPIDLGVIEVAADQEPGPIQPYAAGIAEVSALDGDSVLTGVYDESWTVVIPDPDASPPESGGNDAETGETVRYVVTMHEADGTPIADGAACIVIRDGDEELDSGCTGSPTGAPGVVLLNAVPEGIWSVQAIRIADGRPSVVDLSLTVDTSLWQVSPNSSDYGIGIADITNLADGASLPAGYGTAAAVVLPAP